MRRLTTLILFFVSGIAVAQDYINAYERQKGIARIFQKTLCATCKEKEHIFTFLFDSNGLNTEEQAFHQGKKSGITRYFWNKEGMLLSEHRYHSSSNSQQLWDSTKISQEVRYSYAGSRLDRITWMDGEEQKISHETNLYYDNDGKVAREEHVAYPQAEPYYKTFRYVGDSVFMDYYKKDVRWGKGKKKLNKAGKVLYEATYNAAGTKIYECKNRYSQAGKILEQTIYETGQDGYGNRGNFPGFEKITYRYDQLGKLAIVDKYVKGKVSVTDFYEYLLVAGK